MPRTSSKSLTERLAAQEAKIAAAKVEVQKIKEMEASRLLTIFEDCGYFDVEISDEDLIASIKQLVEQSNSPSLSPVSQQ